MILGILLNNLAPSSNRTYPQFLIPFQMSSINLEKESDVVMNSPENAQTESEAVISATSVELTKL